jgi:DNA-binding IclR family transcriptional regulator
MSSTGDTLRRNQSLIRGISLLQGLAERPAGATVPELAEVTELPRTTTARLLTTLHDLGMVERPNARVWVLGPELARIGRLADPFRPLRDRAYEPLQRLAREIQESAMVAVIYDTWETETILQVDAPNLVGATDWIGRRYGGVLHASATGKLALAALDDAEARAVLGTPKAITAATITDVDALLRHLAEVRTLGWSSTVDELELGLTAVAVPLNDEVVASGAGARTLCVSVSGLSARLTPDRIEPVAARLRDAAAELSASLPAASDAAPQR